MVRKGMGNKEQEKVEIIREGMREKGRKKARNLKKGRIGKEARG